MKIFTTIYLLLISFLTFGQNWVQLSDAPLARHHPISFSLDGKGYAITGTLSGNVPTNDVLEYDPVTDTWTTLSDFPGTARSFGIGAVTNGIAYLGFGASNTSLLNDFWSFDAATETWTQLASCGCSGRRHPAMVAIGDKIYVGLGDDATGDVKDWWMYNINTDSWSQIADIPGDERHHPYMFKAADAVYAGLGHSGNVIYQDWYKLDTATNSWTIMSPFPGEARVAGTQFSHNEFGYVLSGDGDNHSFMATGEMWGYNPYLDEWTQLTPHPGESRWAPGSFVINDDVYFFGGLNRFTNNYPTDLWKFSLVGSSVGLAKNNTNTINVYPNPVNDVVNFYSEDKIVKIEIYDALGKQIESLEVDLVNYNTSNLENGLYIIKLYNDSGLENTSRMLVQH